MKYILQTCVLCVCVCGQEVLGYASNRQHQSFLDDIFGDIAISDQAEEYRNQQIEMGELADTMQTLDRDSSLMFRTNKLHFPDDDDLSDFSKYVPLYSGIVTFAHLPQEECFTNTDSTLDIAIVGAPFDSGVSYSPGTRFGPNGVRQGSRRLGYGLTPIRGNSADSKLRHIDPYGEGLRIVDCGDVPMTPFDARISLNQLYRGERAIHKHDTALKSTHYKKTRVITLGGDHTITLMNLRSAFETYGNESLAVVHFDAHIDTWDPEVVGGNVSKYASINHGTFLHYASELGYVSKGHSVHVGTRAPYITLESKHHDKECGFKTITSKDVDILTSRGVGRKIKEIVGDRKVYLTFDLDTFDIGYINSGTLEAGGLTPREVLTILDELEGIDLVGCDIVEVSTPPNSYDGDNTGLLAAQVIDSLLGLMVVTEV
ncbi:hypothetical protein FOA43_001135 [Brettanomyces nanus]|uniref:Agmatinase n=1 Tax=Eeniella nana TaxID=13502 RepID=A0A875RWU3_EENNA|nr:uncharacterized protein FOA43_001135 [Brettanomyces nanus]QPG73821.1 hypothetical protein FOA43_001135 [Brettanomyces nanus]